MPRYELVEGTSRKFWEIRLEDQDLTTRWGRIGTEGQQQTKSLSTAALAKKEHDKLVAEKLKKGYRMRGLEAGGLAAKQSRSRPGKRNADLEKAILAAPDRVDPYLVYADWLQEQGEPRGELVTLQHALTKDTKNKALRKKEAELLGKHKDAFLGPLGAFERSLDGNDRPSFSWHLGFIKGARFAWDHYADEARGRVNLGDGVRALLEHPSGFVLRELTFGINRADPDQLYQPLIDALAKHGAPALEMLHVGDFEYPDETEISWTELGKYDKVWAALPRLRKLVLQGGGIKLGKIDAPALVDVEIRTGGLPGSSVSSIASARWPKIERLIVWLGTAGYGAGGKPRDLKPLMDAKGVPVLRVLGLMNSDWSDELCGMLGSAKVVRQLRELDLSMGTMTDDGARRLIASPKAFQHLDRLSVADNFLTNAVKKDVMRLARKVEWGSQRTPDDYDGEVHRYVSVGE